MAQREEYKQANVALGKRLRTAREMKGLTREVLAEAAGISTQFVGDLERGRMGPSVQTICSFCEVLGISADYLLRGDTYTPGIAVSEIAAILSSVPPKYHKQIVASVRTQADLIKLADEDS